MRLALALALALALTACAAPPRAPRKPHPASAASEPGRLAPVTPSLAPGSVVYPGVTAPAKP